MSIVIPTPLKETEYAKVCASPGISTPLRETVSVVPGVPKYLS
jgi:hypothetical protein